MPGFGSRGVNSATARSVYPSLPGANVGQLGTSGTDFTVDPLTTAGDPDGMLGVNGNPPAQVGGLFGRPVTWYLTFIVLFFVLTFVAKKAGQDSDFSNIRLSGYNILTITLASAIGITLMKLLFNKFPVAGLREFWNAV